MAKLLPVGWHDDRLKTPGCLGFAVGGKAATFGTTDVGVTIAYGGSGLSLYDYFSISFPSTAPHNDVGNIYNDQWIVGGLDGTDFTAGGQGIGGLLETGQAYVVVDDSDETLVVAGSLFASPFSFSDELTSNSQGFCMDVLHDIWTPSGAVEATTDSVALDASGYFAEANYGTFVAYGGPTVVQPEDHFITTWQRLFNPPNWVDPVFGPANNGPLGGPFPLCLICDAESNPGGNSLTMTLVQPTTYHDADQFRANQLLSGGLNYARPGAQNCGSFPIVNDGAVGRIAGSGNHRISIFPFLCNRCPTELDWIGWMIGIHVSEIRQVFIPPTQSTSQRQLP